MLSSNKNGVNYHPESVACEQPKGHARYVQDFISLACKFSALLKSYSLFDDLRIYIGHKFSSLDRDNGLQNRVYECV